jgi:peptidoglycan hydrolase-like protein with peptidoglycan-binding domain
MRFKDFFSKRPDPKVIEIQKMLKSKGYDLGTFGPNKDGIDGVMGAKTQAALDAYKAGQAPSAVKPDTGASKTTPSSEKPSSGTGEVIPSKGPVTSTISS